MKIKRLLVLAVLPMLCLAVNAQNSSKDNTPKKEDFYGSSYCWIQ